MVAARGIWMTWALGSGCCWSWKWSLVDECQAWLDWQGMMWRTDSLSTGRSVGFDCAAVEWLEAEHS
eukprot:3717456-Amphidinium_carterae.1